MKKVVSFTLFFVCISILFFGCSKLKDSNTLAFSFDKNGNYLGFSDLPKNYTIKEAKDDGCFVRQNMKVIANQNVWDNFVKTSSHKENTSIRLIELYTGNTDIPYFMDLFYQDGYYYLFDSSAEKQEKQPYSYLLTLEGKFGNPLRDSGVIVLTNDDALTFDKVMKTMLSSNTSYTKDISPYRLVMFK